LTEGNVRSIAIQRVGELRAREREALELLLGRPLQQNEEVSIRSYPHDLLLEDAARQRAAGDLASLLAQRSERTSDLSESELDRAADEAIRFVSGFRHPG
jgi:hypothetical protein